MVVTCHWSYIIWFPYGLYVHTDITVLTRSKHQKWNTTCSHFPTRTLTASCVPKWRTGGAGAQHRSVGIGEQLTGR